MAGTDVLRTVREAIYAAFVHTGAAPGVDALARAANLTSEAVEDACRTLADAHVIVLEAGTTRIWSAPPFSGVPTPFVVRAGVSVWYAPCAWDSFGIPAAIKGDAAIETRCAWSDELIPCGVQHGGTYGDALIHLLVPAEHFWDDIVYT
jgi:Alkylmercury lyase